MPSKILQVEFKQLYLNDSRDINNYSGQGQSNKNVELGQILFISDEAVMVVDS